jgi:hypothetical protein
MVALGGNLNGKAQRRKGEGSKYEHTGIDKRPGMD